MSIQTDKHTGNYYIDRTVRVPGENKPRRIKKWLDRGTTRKQAEAVERAMVAAANEGRIEDLRRGGYVRDAASAPVPFSGMADQWFEQSVRANRSYSYQRTTDQIIRVHLVPFFGDRDMRAITQRDVRAYLAEKKAAGLSPKTLFNHLIPIRQIFKWARGAEHPVGNPTIGVELPKVQAAEVVWLDVTQSEAFLAATRAAEPAWHALFFTALATGMRQGELLGLKWSAVDFAQAVIRVCNNPVLRQDGPTKTRRARTLPMRGDLAEVLAGLGRKGEYVFHDAAGEPVTPDMVKRPFARALAVAGLPRVRFHDLRHSFASQLVSRGQSIYPVGQLLGHSTGKTTERYAHLAPSALRDVINSVSFGSPGLKAIEGGRAD